jgi:signal peptidase I
MTTNSHESIVRNSGNDDKKNKMELFDWLQCVVFAIIIVIFCFIFIGRTIGVDGLSMYGTLHDRDRVVTSNLFYTPSNNDIIIFRSQSPRYEEPLVKRVIAIEGQTIDIDFETGDVILDGVVLYEPFIHSLTIRRDDFTGPVTIPEGYVFVLGDNRNNSVDSRYANIGLVDTRYILGRVLFLLIPGADQSGQRNWSRFGSLA